MADAYLPRTELLIITLTNGSRTYTYATNLVRWKEEACKHAESVTGTVVRMYHWRKVESLGSQAWHLYDKQEFKVGRV